MTSKKVNIRARIIFVSLLLAFALILGTGISSAATPAFKTTGKVNSWDGAFVREKATRASSKVAGLRDNTKIKILDEVFVAADKYGAKKKWYRISSGSKTGYIRSDLVDGIKYTKTVKVKTTARVRYRKGAGLSMPRVGTFAKNKELTAVLESTSANNTKWYKIKYGKKYYYVLASKVKVVEKEPTIVETVVTAIVGTPEKEPEEVVQSTAAAKVAKNAASWAKTIANDDEFHYGNGTHSHHNGCYFCGTQPKAKKKYVVQWEKTYCCNPFVTAAYAHGGNEPFMLDLCSHGKSYMAPEFKRCDRFANLGHPDQSELKTGDILCATAHVAIYVGDGKIAEAWISDDGKPGSSKWNKSIAINSLTAKRYKGFNAGVFRYIGAPETSTTTAADTSAGTQN